MPPLRLNPLRRSLPVSPRAVVPNLISRAPSKPTAVDTFTTQAVDPGWLTRAGPAPVNVNPQFDALYQQAASGKLALPAEAKDHVYLTVPGLFNDRVIAYMKDNEKGLRAAGLDVRHVNVNGDGSTEENAKAVRDAILEASKGGKKVVLIGHSKGGVDASAALALYPELKEHVRANITMQSPVGGSPIANDLLSNAPTRRFADGVVKAFGGDARSIRDLSYEHRKAFNAEHPYPAEIPTLSLASYTTNPLTPLGAPAAYLKARYREANDGLVLTKDAVLPGARAVLIPNLDHACMILKGFGGFSSLEPAQSAQALVALALSPAGSN